MFRNKILVVVTLLSMLISLAAGQWIDVANDFWASDYITQVTEKNYIEGA